MKSSNLRHSLAHSQNKGLSKYQRRGSWLQTGPSPHWRQRGRWAKPEPESKGQSRPQRWHPSPNCEQASVAYQVFLGSWMVDICQEGHSLEIGSPMQTYSTPEKLLSGDWMAGTGEVIKMHRPPGTVCSPSTSLPELLWPGKGTKSTPNWVCAFVEYWEPEPEQLRPVKCMKCRARFGQYPCRETWSLSSVDWESTHHSEPGQTQCGPYTVRTPYTCQWYLFAVFLHFHSTTEQVSLNKWPPLPLCVRAEIRHWSDLQTEEAKINKEEGTALKVTDATD